MHALTCYLGRKKLSLSFLPCPTAVEDLARSYTFTMKRIPAAGPEGTPFSVEVPQAQRSLDNGKFVLSIPSSKLTDGAGRCARVAGMQTRAFGGHLEWN